MVQAVIHTMKLQQPDLWLKGTSDNSCAPCTLEASAFLFSPREEDDQAITEAAFIGSGCGKTFLLVWVQVTFCYDLSQNPVFKLRKRCINQDETGFLLPLPATIYTMSDLVPSC